MSRVFAILLIGLHWGCNQQPPENGILDVPHGIQSGTSPSTLKALPLGKPLRLSQDLGVVRTETKHEVEFQIQNPSESDWLLHDITKTCKCVVADPLPQIIKKREAAKVKLTIDVGQASGDFDRQVRMNFTNGPQPLTLEVKTRMRTPLYVSCRELRFPLSPPGTTIQATARVENWSDAKWDTVKIDSSVDWIQTQVEPLPITAGDPGVPGLQVQQMWHVILTANPPPEVTGSMSQSVAIRAVGADHTATLPVVGERPHPVISRPPALIVSRTDSSGASSSDGRKLVASISLPLTSPAKSFRILSVTGKLLDECEIDFEQVSHTEARVEVVFPPSKKGGVSGRVIVKFADGLPDLVIPVAGGV